MPKRKIESAGEVAIEVVGAVLGFGASDALDRFLSTYNPSKEQPADKFTSSGSGTLANTLNVGSAPSLTRLGAGAATVALPAIGAMATEGVASAAFEGAAIGAVINLAKTIWNGLIVPMLISKDTSNESLRGSYIARLYPAEVAAKINREQAAMSAPITSAFGALSAHGIQDQYPTIQNMWGTGEEYPTQQNVWGTGSDYATTAQSLREQAGMRATLGAWAPGPPSEAGPGPKAEPHKDPACGCIGDPTIGAASWLGEPPHEGANGHIPWSMDRVSAVVQAAYKRT